MYRVIKQIIFDTFDKINKRVIFEPEMELDYKRLWMNGKPYLQISCDDICTDSFIEGPDFPIEDCVEPIIEETPLSNMSREIQESIKEQEEYTKAFNLGLETGKSMKDEKPYTVQIDRIESKRAVNDILKGIPGKNVIDIKPMENNTYLVIYKEYEE